MTQKLKAAAASEFYVGRIHQVKAYYNMQLARVLRIVFVTLATLALLEIVTIASDLYVPLTTRLISVVLLAVVASYLLGLLNDGIRAIQKLAAESVENSESHFKNERKIKRAIIAESNGDSERANLIMSELELEMEDTDYEIELVNASR